MSRPSKLARTVAGWFASGFIYPHILATVQEAVVGLALGIVAGVVIGMLFAFFPFLSGIFHPLIVVFNATPRIALAPLFIVWLGIGLASKVAMVVSLVFFIIFFSTYAGLRDVDVNLVNHVRVMGGTRADLMRHVLLPSALTWIFASLRACVGFAVIGAIIGEYPRSRPRHRLDRAVRRVALRRQHGHLGAGGADGLRGHARRLARLARASLLPLEAEAAVKGDRA